LELAPVSPRAWCRPECPILKVRAQTGHASDATLARYIRDGEMMGPNLYRRLDAGARYYAKPLADLFVYFNHAWHGQGDR